MMNRRRALVLAPAALALAVAARAHDGPMPARSDADPRPARGRPAPAGIGGPLDLVDHGGRRFGLDRVRGRPALLFFGFTRCGATCPVAMAAARSLLAESSLPRPPVILFITLDPLNDGPRELAEWVQGIDPRIVGLTGTPDQVERAAEAYGVGLRAGAGGPDHSSMWYLLDGRGRVRTVYPHDTSPRELARGLAAAGGSVTVGEVRP